MRCNLSEGGECFELQEYIETRGNSNDDWSLNPLKENGERQVKSNKDPGR